MPHKSEEDSSPETRNFVFLLAIAGRLDAQAKIFAKKLDNDRYIYHSYAILDSLSSSYSMFKYFFEVFISNSNDQDLMHEIMTSPGGIAAITSEALFLVTFSFLASYFDGQDNAKNNKAARFIVAAWPFFRDAIKGLKNAYKGWKSLAQIITVMGGVDIKHLIVPIGLVLGILAAANRFWLRNMVEMRKEMMDANKKLLHKIQKLPSYDEDEAKNYLNELQFQSREQRIHAFFATAAGGFIDGLYLYAGVLSLAVLCPQAYIAMAAISLFYTLSCVVSRVSEEYDFQLRLLATQTRCRLTLAGKELETAYAMLLREPLDSETYPEKKRKVLELINKVDELRTQLQQQTTRSYATAALLGLKHGLFAYGVLSTTLFMVCSVFSITAVVFPPALLIACISIGLALMLGVMTFTTVDHYKYLQKQKIKEDAPYDKIVQMKDGIANELVNTDTSLEDFKAAVKDGVSPKGSPQYLFQEWLETLRSFTSGISKGNNFSTFISTPFQDVDPTQHEHDMPVGTMVTFASAALFSVVLALRAFARGFGRTAPGQISADDKEQQSNEKATEEDTSNDQASKNKHVPKINWAESIIRYAGSFFTKPPAAKNTMNSRTSNAGRPNAESTSPTGLELGNTIAGLE